MPRLSLYRPTRTSDYRFFDRTISEMFTVGGLEIYIHKYLGPKAQSATGDATQPAYQDIDPLNVEDLLLGEIRDRKYDTDIYIMRGVYNVQDIDFDLSQFGLFLNNDTLFITFHYNDMIDTVQRKLMVGDVLEFPNLKDRHPLDLNKPPLPRYYVVQDAAYASEGFSQTWQPHLWRVKATPLSNTQEYQDILDRPLISGGIWDSGNYYPDGSVVQDGDDWYRAVQSVPPGVEIGNVGYWQLLAAPTLADQAGTRTRELVINDAILTQSEAEVPLSGYDTVRFFIYPTDEDGNPAEPRGSTDDSTETGATPRSNGWTLGYLTGDGLAPNGLPVTPGVNFPAAPLEGDYALRLDFWPNRLFRYNGNRWLKIEDSVRTDLTNGVNNNTLRSTFVNNTYTVSTTDQGNIPSRQSLSDLLKPLADNGNDGGNKTARPYPPTHPGHRSSGAVVNTFDSNLTTLDSSTVTFDPDSDASQGY